jgi:hypothetical protein
MKRLAFGDIREFTIDGRGFTPQSGASFTITMGGYDNEVTRGGNGDLTIKQSAVPGKIGDAAVIIDHEAGDMEFIRTRKDSAKVCNVAVTLVSGVVYQGDLVIAGEVGLSSGDGNVTLSLEGGTIRKL